MAFSCIATALTAPHFPRDIDFRRLDSFELLSSSFAFRRPFALAPSTTTAADALPALSSSAASRLHSALRACGGSFVSSRVVLDGDAHSTAANTAAGVSADAAAATATAATAGESVTAAAAAALRSHFCAHADERFADRCVQLYHMANVSVWRLHSHAARESRAATDAQAAVARMSVLLGNARVFVQRNSVAAAAAAATSISSAAAAATCGAAYTKAALEFQTQQTAKYRDKLRDLHL